MVAFSDRLAQRGHAPKNTELLAYFGLDDYAQSIDNLNVDTIEQQFDRITREAPDLLPRMQQALQRAQGAAEAQLDEVLTLLTAHRSTRP